MRRYIIEEAAESMDSARAEILKLCTTYKEDHGDLFVWCKCRDDAQLIADEVNGFLI